MKQADRAANTRARILEAALKLIRTKGFAATTVDDLCREAAVTKGAFFHHFASKDQMGEEAAQYFSDMACNLFAGAPYAEVKDPLQRFYGYLDFRKVILQGDIPQFTCLLGTLVQEVHETHPGIRSACEKHMWGHADGLVPMIDEAKKMYAPDANWSSESLALFTQAVLQGAFILAKANQGPQVAADSIDHLRRYIESLFSTPSNAFNN